MSQPTRGEKFDSKLGRIYMRALAIIFTIPFLIAVGASI
jgi:hypothetical protein